MHHPRAHMKIVLEAAETAKTHTEKQFAELKRRLTKHALFTTIHDTKVVSFNHPPWSFKPWKYVTRQKWLKPDISFMKRQ